MKKLFTLIAASVIFSACGSVTGKIADQPSAAGAKPQIGETVVFKTGPINYSEGKIEKIEGGKYEIRAGSNIGKADAGDVYALPKPGAKADVKTGDFVVAFTNDIYWTGGEVKNVTADLIEVEKAAGGKLNVAPDKVLKVSPAAVADIKQNVETKAFDDLGKTKKPVLPKNWKPKSGEKIAAQWAFGTWHTAIIKTVTPNKIDVDWQNGWSDGTVAPDKIAALPTTSDAPPKVGDYVIIKPQNDLSDWKFATVTTINGQEAELKLADGKTQKLKIGDFIAMN